jgi:hypothetical protein
LSSYFGRTQYAVKKEANDGFRSDPVA